MKKPRKTEAPAPPHAAPVFETLAILDDSKRDPETNAAIPSGQSVRQAKRWVDENEL